MVRTPKRNGMRKAMSRSQRPTSTRERRGAGLTRACGTGACAALAAAHRLGLADRAAAVRFLDGGVLDVEWCAGDGRIRMTGDAELSFRGEVPEAALL